MGNHRIHVLTDWDFYLWEFIGKASVIIINTLATHIVHPRLNQHTWNKRLRTGDGDPPALLQKWEQFSSSEPSPQSCLPSQRYPREMHSRPSRHGTEDRVQRRGGGGGGGGGVGVAAPLTSGSRINSVSAGQSIWFQQWRCASTAPLPENPCHGWVATFFYLIGRKNKDPWSFDYVCGVLAHHLVALNLGKLFSPFRPINFNLNFFTAWYYILGMQNKVSFWRQGLVLSGSCCSIWWSRTGA